ncbi:hypothetical protein GDO81_020325 [Engystomops pustulosus]|uniref:Uncharacterized protein n=1 Tax=Engystomops pustulosus TaxID=76066 RepID=A0AAV6ZJX2_ENGPU|nr:hypothetical protein GDO81_020325 [Engystomops pustulosus]
MLVYTILVSIVSVATENPLMLRMCSPLYILSYRAHKTCHIQQCSNNVAKQCPNGTTKCSSATLCPKKTQIRDCSLKISLQHPHENLVK